VGVWLVGNYTSTPVVFLPVLFVVIALATYKFGQYGQRQVPYSFFLLGLTTLTMATDGLSAPDHVWRLGLYRTEEIVVGVISTLLITSILWPRYASDEFDAAARDTLASVGPLVSAATERQARGLEMNLALDDIRESFARRLAVLSNLRQAGAREGSLFTTQLSHYNAWLVSLTSVFDGALYLGERPLINTPVVEQLREELGQVFRGIEEEIRILSAPAARDERLPPSSLDTAFANLERKVAEVREHGFFANQPITVGIIFASYFAALRSLRDELNNLRDITENLPRRGRLQPRPIVSWDQQPAIDWFWVRIGIKGGLAATIGVTLLMWIHPPGPAWVPVMAWLTTILTRPWIRSGGTGDLRAFRNAFLGCLALAGCAVVALVTTPLLASYFAMNVGLFIVLFSFGFATAKITGSTFAMQLALIVISAFVGLNPQQPVSSQTIIDTFLGIGIGLFIGTAVGRLIWPVLPQTVLRENLLGLLAGVKALLSGDPHPEAVRIQLALRSIEAFQAVRLISIPGRSKQEKAQERERLHLLMMELQALAPRVHHLTALHNDLPQAALPLLRLPLQRLNVEFTQLLDAFAGCVRTGSARRGLLTLATALAEMDEAVRQIRDRRILPSYPVRVPLLTLDIVGRYHAVADALNKIRSSIIDLQLNRYWGDYAL
jgi:hypothetical protein